MKKYFISFDGKDQKGGFSFDELKQQGINRDTLIWYEGLANWTKASDLPELAHLLPIAPPSLPKTATPPPISSTQSLK